MIATRTGDNAQKNPSEREPRGVDPTRHASRASRRVAKSIVTHPAKNGGTDPTCPNRPSKNRSTALSTPLPVVTRMPHERNRAALTTTRFGPPTPEVSARAGERPRPSRAKSFSSARDSATAEPRSCAAAIVSPAFLAAPFLSCFRMNRTANRDPERRTAITRRHRHPAPCALSRAGQVHPRARASSEPGFGGGVSCPSPITQVSLTFADPECHPPKAVPRIP